MNKKLLLLISFLSLSIILLNAQDREPAREQYNRQEYNSLSSFYKDSIDYDILQGNWVAYEGSYFDDYEVVHVTDTKPMHLQIKENTYRTTLGGKFYPFQSDKNLIIFYTDENLPDSAYINLITDKELYISYKKGECYEQYRYKK